jgi:KUP system potassium uptake protein
MWTTRSRRRYHQRVSYLGHTPAATATVDAVVETPPETAAPPVNEAPQAARRVHAKRDFALGLAALGVVYGDVGTSPLYAMRECFAHGHGVPLTPANILGTVSLAVWALILVICLKYTVFVLRADNEGEGGALALLAKIPARKQDGLPTRPFLLVAVLLFGAAALLADGVVTPAISVLSAMEGLGVAQNRIVTYTGIVLVLLFLIQRFGTSRVGSAFGPVMVVWFGVLALLGLVHVVLEPRILLAIDPRHAIGLLGSGQPGSYLILGAIILCVGGGEALYADLGHFGRRPIVAAWYRAVLPALLLVYMGQGALLLRSPAAIENPFYAMAPGFLRYPLVALATAATVIASQALISGSFSLTRQAVNLGFLPRVTVKHTSRKETGQIYVPVVNTVLMCGCLAMVIGFGSSSKLSAAYGLSTNLTMTTTSIGFFFVMWRVWRVNVLASFLLVAVFLTVDLAFLGANLAKLLQGGWVPLVLGSSFFSLTLIWRWGRRRLAANVLQHTSEVEAFLARADLKGAFRVPATGVFLTSSTSGIPWSVIHHFERGGVLYRDVVLLSLLTHDIPFVEPKQRLTVTQLGGGFHRVIAHFGYEETPNVPSLLEFCAIHGLVVDFDKITYVVGRDVLRLKREHGPLSIPRRIYRYLSRNQAPAVGHFGMPVDRVIEIGIQMEL